MTTPIAKIFIATYDFNARIRERAPKIRMNAGKYAIDVEPIDYGHGELEKHGYRYELASSGVMIKDHYSEADIAERNRLNALVPLNHGDIVEDQNGRLFEVNVRGNYSDAGFLKPLFEPEASQHAKLHKGR